MILKSSMPFMIGCVLVDDRVGHVGFEGEVRLAVLLGAADDVREVLGVVGAQRVVQADDPAAAPQELIEVRAILEADVAGVTLVDHEDVDACELACRWKVQTAVHVRAAVLENLAPVGEELRIVVLPLGVRLRAAVQIDLHRRHITGPAQDRVRGPGPARRSAPAAGAPADGGCCARTVVTRLAAATAMSDARTFETLMMTPQLNQGFRSTGPIAGYRGTTVPAGVRHTSS